MNTLKLYRFSTPIQLTPLETYPNATSEEGSLYYSSTDGTIKIRQIDRWENLATVRYVNAQEFGSDNIDVSGKSEKDYMTWNGDVWQATTATIEATTGSAYDLIGTNASGYLDATFLQYDLDRGGYAIYNLPNPTSDTEAATKGYVDNEELGRNNLYITYNSVPGAKRLNDILRWNGNQWQNVMAVQRAEPETGLIDEIISTDDFGLLDKSFLFYDLDRQGYQIYNLPEPQQSDEAATKGYVDSQPFGTDNILITGIQDRDLLQYDSGLGKWKNVRGLALENSGSTTNVYVMATNFYETVDNSTTTVEGSLVMQSAGGGSSFTLEDGSIGLSTGDLSLAANGNELRLGGGGGGDTYITITSNNEFNTYSTTNNNQFDVQNNNITNQFNTINNVTYTSVDYQIDTTNYVTNVDNSFEVSSSGGGSKIELDSNKVKLGFDADVDLGGGGGTTVVNYFLEASGTSVSLGGGDTIINVTNNAYHLAGDVSLIEVNESKTFVNNYSETTVINPSTGSPDAGIKLGPNGEERRHASSFRKASGNNDPEDRTLHLVEIYNTNLILNENQSGYIAAASFSRLDYAGARIEYRLKDQTNGDVRIGTLYIGANSGDASCVDNYAETADLDVSLSAEVVGTQVRLNYENGLHIKSLHFDAKYFPH